MDLRKAAIAISIIAIMLLVIVGLYLTLKPNPDTRVGRLDEVGGPVDLGTVEVKEYKGQRLDSSDAFHENSIAGVQYIDRDAYRLSVYGLVGQPKEFTYQDVLDQYQHYRKVVTVNCVEGWSARILWEGVLVRDIIDACAPNTSARVVIFHAYDGYTTSLPIEYFYDRDVLMAYGMNNVTLKAERGFPFQLVAENKWGYKWIKWIDGIELSDDIGYKGYWEDRGYSNSGDLDEDFSG
jgi:DMSO/TMAO reductase YedYZ molybdopterin-dependent catalytic subunit